MFDTGPNKVATPAASAEQLSAGKKHDQRAATIINNTIADLRNDPDQIAKHTSSLLKSLGKLETSGQSNALDRVSTTIDEVKEQTLGVGKDVPLESVDLDSPGGRYYARLMAEELIQELTFLVAEIETETENFEDATFSPKNTPVGIAGPEALVDQQSQEQAKQEGLTRQFGLELESLLGQALGRELPQREPLANANKELQELGHEANQAEHLGLRLAEELDQLQGSPKQEQLEAIPGLAVGAEEDPLAQFREVAKSVTGESLEPQVKKFDAKVRTVTTDTGEQNSSRSVRSKLAEELAEEKNRPSWVTAA